MKNFVAFLLLGILLTLFIQNGYDAQFQAGMQECQSSHSVIMEKKWNDGYEKGFYIGEQLEHSKSEKEKEILKKQSFQEGYNEASRACSIEVELVIEDYEIELQLKDNQLIYQMKLKDSLEQIYNDTFNELKEAKTSLINQSKIKPTHTSQTNDEISKGQIQNRITRIVLLSAFIMFVIVMTVVKRTPKSFANKDYPKKSHPFP